MQRVFILSKKNKHNPFHLQFTILVYSESIVVVKLCVFSVLCGKIGHQHPKNIGMERGLLTIISDISDLFYANNV